MGPLFQRWLIHGMGLLVVLLAVLWLWDGLLAEPLGQLIFVALAPLLLVLAAGFVRRAYAPGGRFVGWRRLLGLASTARAPSKPAGRAS